MSMTITIQGFKLAAINDAEKQDSIQNKCREKAGKGHRAMIMFKAGNVHRHDVNLTSIPRTFTMKGFKLSRETHFNSSIGIFFAIFN